MISIKVDQQALGQLLGKLENLPKGLATATSRAGNKTLTATRAEMVRLIRTRYAIKAGDVRKALVLRKMYPAQLEGSIKGESSPGVPLLTFARTKALPSTKRTKAGGYTPKVGIPVLVRKDKGRRTVRGAFTAKMQSGHKGVFVRGSRWKAGRKTTKSNLGQREIVELYGPTPVKLLEASANAGHIEQFAQDSLDKNMQHEAEFYLRQQGLL